MDKNATNLLISRLMQGDERAFSEIYEQYWSRLYSLCFYYTQSGEDTEDILMELFTSLWKNKDCVHIDAIDPYLVKAAKNLSLKYIQKRQRHRKFTRKFRERIQPDIPEFELPDKLLETKELTTTLEHHIQSLPEKTKRIFLLNRDKGLTYGQIAAALNISEKTVEYHISKALRMLTGQVLILLTILLLK